MNSFIALIYYCGPFSCYNNTFLYGWIRYFHPDWHKIMLTHIHLGLKVLTYKLTVIITCLRTVKPYKDKVYDNIIIVIGFKLVAGAIASNAFTGVAIGVGFIFASLVYSISRNPSQRDELLRFSFIGFSLVEASGLIGLVMSFVLLFGL